MAELSEAVAPGGGRAESGPAVGKPAGRRAGLSAAVVPGPAGARGVDPQRRGDLRLGGPRAGRARRDAGDARRRPAVGPAGPVWDQLTSTRTGCRRWSGSRPNRRSNGSSPGRRPRTEQELLGTEVGFRCDVDLGGERVHLTGTADRVERDPDGRIRIVDFKTGRSEPPGRRRGGAGPARRLPARRRRRGRSRSVAGPDARPGGAELVYLRLPDAGGPLPKVFGQASLEDVPFPVAEPTSTTEPIRQPGRRSRPGCTAGCCRGPADPGRAFRRPARARPAATARSAAAARPRPRAGRSSHEAWLTGCMTRDSRCCADGSGELRRRRGPDRGARACDVLRPAARGDHRAARARRDHRRAPGRARPR